MSEANAWLLDLGGGRYAAVGELEMVHVLPDAPPVFEIPLAPDYCRRVLIWQDEILPLMAMATRLADRSSDADEDPELVVITVFEAYPGAPPQHGALLLDAAPTRIRVSDAEACELPESQAGWRHLAISCFKHPDLGPVPVLDLGAAFSSPCGVLEE